MLVVINLKGKDAILFFIELMGIGYTVHQQEKLLKITLDGYGFLLIMGIFVRIAFKRSGSFMSLHFPKQKKVFFMRTTYAIYTGISLILIVFFSCRSPEKPTDSPIVIDIDEVISNTNKKSFLETFEAISLGRNNALIPPNYTGALVGDIIKKYDNRFYLLDKKQRVIFAFDDKGNEIFQIKRQGRGPGEYLNIFDFFLLDNQLHLVTSFGRVMVFENDLYVRDYHLPFIPMYCEYLGNNMVVFQNIFVDNSYKYRLVLYCIEKMQVAQKVYTEQGIDDDAYPFWRQKHLWRSGNVVLFNNDYSREVFKITSQGIELLFAIKGDVLPTNDQIERYNSNPSLRQVELNKVFSLESLFFQDKTVLFSFNHKFIPYQVFFNLESKEFNSFISKSPSYFAVSESVGYGLLPPYSNIGSTQQFQFVKDTFLPHLLNQKVSF
jgi:hypothetical protein